MRMHIWMGCVGRWPGGCFWLLTCWLDFLLVSFGSYSPEPSWNGMSTTKIDYVLSSWVSDPGRGANLRRETEECRMCVQSRLIAYKSQSLGGEVRGI